MKFKGESIIKFHEAFQDDKSCLSYLSDIKWNEGYQCKKCGHDKF